MRIYAIGDIHGQLERLREAHDRILRDGGEEAVDAAVQSARIAQQRWWGMTASDRGRVLWRIGQLVREQLEPIARLEARTGGKILGDARAETCLLYTSPSPRDS